MERSSDSKSMSDCSASGKRVFMSQFPALSVYKEAFMAEKF